MCFWYTDCYTQLSPGKRRHRDTLFRETSNSAEMEKKDVGAFDIDYVCRAYDQGTKMEAVYQDIREA